MISFRRCGDRGNVRVIDFEMFESLEIFYFVSSFSFVESFKGEGIGVFSLRTEDIELGGKYMGALASIILVCNEVLCWAQELFTCLARRAPGHIDMNPPSSFGEF